MKRTGYLVNKYFKYSDLFFFFVTPSPFQLMNKCFFFTDPEYEKIISEVEKGETDWKVIVT